MVGTLDRVDSNKVGIDIICIESDVDGTLLSFLQSDVAILIVWCA